MNDTGNNTQAIKEARMADEMDTVRYRGEQGTMQELLQAAIDAFGAEHCGLPDGIILPLFRLLTQLPASQWIYFKAGAIPIALYTPQSDDLPSPMQYVTVAWDEIFCFRAAHIDTSIDDSSAETGQGEPTLHGSTRV
jgi:hypothetical protein